ncbi:glycoside hydrolase family protein [Psychrosphaera sp. B3R10]|uniref:glycoside hydrolase family protein n=1 Tax=unclassified Psychrosphaera TaxID=2641570 RepID=UPI001C09C68D|nr:MULTISPECIES: glycoside hydrolase family protein [unclassified Psychrosphaera]MBU2882477.1 glycoside hydrolase family protein [Psychrosphaera sp. I2R16]MBU2990298.1 glycoside hydrolase family protein [Psychrosphaera sp. B3R10]MDO6721260.1 glycoside hydrolase family protein [Psychrosphaera sp. 1_MG-2023]
MKFAFLKRSLFAFLFLIPGLSQAETYDFDYEYVGKVLEKKDTHIWGASPIIGPDGKVHLFVAQWPTKTQKNFSGWFKDSEIGHYVADKPEGPFTYLGKAVADLDTGFNAPHNPTIKYLDGKYVLTFIVNSNNQLKTQRIIMFVADDLKGNWRPAKSAEADGTILRKSTDKTAWNYHARLGVSNPSLIKKDGKYLLYLKSVIQKNPKKKRGAFTYGIASSDNLEGPYTYHKSATTRAGIEDAYAFEYKDSVYLLSRDFGNLKGDHGGGLLWRSDDGMFFPEEKITRSFEALEHYVGKAALKDSIVYRGKINGRLERPQILFIDGKPAYVYMATGINETPEHGSASHLFKIIPKKVD